MLRLRSLRRILTGSVLVVAAGCSLGQSEMPARPSNVSEDAALVGGAKAWWWVKCLRSGEENRCQVFNVEGGSLYDEPYRPADGGGPVAQSEIVIDTRRTQPTHVFLVNGRVLLPSTDFERHKRFFDEVTSP